MRTIIAFTILTVFYLTTFAQLTGIEWQNTIGGSDMDRFGMVHETEDGGYVLGGWSLSNISGDKDENRIGGGQDYWVLKIDSVGQIEWQNTIGGNGVDELNTMVPTTDGGYILGGFSGSDISGDKTEPNYGSWDYWVVKIDSLGIVEWDNTIGGSGGDNLYSINQTTDGGYIIGGMSESNISFDKTENAQGESDYWILKLDESGAIEWQNTIGGNSYDGLSSIEQTIDGGYLLCGYSYSCLSGDKSEDCLGEADYWIVKVDSIGDIEWQHTMGGSDNEFPSKILELGEDEFVVIGTSASNISEDKNENSIGSGDYWIFQMNSLGAISWQNTIGGSELDQLRAMDQTSDNGYILAGYSYSNASIDKAENGYGDADYWVVKVNATGMMEWENTLGGGGGDELISVSETTDGGYILCGWSDSNASTDKDETTMGGDDCWIIKHVNNPPSIYLDNDGDGYGDSANSIDSFLLTEGYVINNGDCNDTNSLISPEAIEICNGIDDNCNGAIDDGYESCSGDFSTDGSVNTADLLLFTTFYGYSVICPFYDLTGDSVVNISDLLVFTAVFGSSCE